MVEGIGTERDLLSFPDIGEVSAGARKRRQKGSAIDKRRSPLSC